MVIVAIGGFIGCVVGCVVGAVTWLMDARAERELYETLGIE